MEMATINKYLSPIRRWIVGSLNIMKCKWDILIVLDACRFDAFKEVNTIKGRLTRIGSVGSTSGIWLKKTFTKKCSNIIYVSASPLISYIMLKQDLGFVPFETVIEVFRDGWDEELETVHPREVNKAFLNLDYSPKHRYIIHYMQPHHPFIASKNIHAKGFVQWRKKMGFPPRTSDKELTVWDMLKAGMLTRKEVWEAYIANLELVLKYANDLCKHPRFKACKIVITSDHGNLFGKYGLYEEPSNFPLHERMEVPYLIVENV